MLPSVMTCLMVWAAFSTAYLQQSVDGSSTRPPAMKAKMWRRHLHQQDPYSSPDLATNVGPSANMLPSSLGDALSAPIVPIAAPSPAQGINPNLPTPTAFYWLADGDLDSYYGQYNGTGYNVTYVQDDQAGYGALTCSEANDSMVLLDAVPYGTKGPFAINVWVKVTSLSGSQFEYVFSHNSTVPETSSWGPNQVQLYFPQFGHPAYGIVRAIAKDSSDYYEGLSSITFLDSDGRVANLARNFTRGAPIPDLKDGSWHMLSLTSQPDGSIGYRMYVDGLLAGQMEGNQTYVGSDGMQRDVDGGKPMVIDGKMALCGRSDDTPQRGYTGSLAELAIWNAVLTADQVSAIYKSGLGYPPMPEAPSPAPASDLTAAVAAVPPAITPLTTGSSVPSSTPFPLPYAFFPLADNMLDADSAVGLTSGYGGDTYDAAWVQDPDVGVVIECNKHNDSTVLLDTVPYAASGRWAINLWMKPGPLYGDNFQYLFSHAQQKFFTTGWESNQIRLFYPELDHPAFGVIRAIAKDNTDTETGPSASVFLDSDNLVGQLVRNFTDQAVALGQVILQDGKWHMLTLTTLWDGTPGYAMLVDGQLAGVLNGNYTYTGSNGTVLHNDGGAPMNLSGPIVLCGRSSNDTVRGYNGRLTHLALFDQAITPLEAYAIYMQGLPSLVTAAQAPGQAYPASSNALQLYGMPVCWLTKITDSTPVRSCPELQACIPLSEMQIAQNMGALSVPGSPSSLVGTVGVCTAAMDSGYHLPNATTVPPPMAFFPLTGSPATYPALATYPVPQYSGYAMNAAQVADPLFGGAVVCERDLQAEVQLDTVPYATTGTFTVNVWVQVNATLGTDMEYIFSHSTMAGSTGYYEDPWAANQVEMYFPESGHPAFGIFRAIVKDSTDVNHGAASVVWVDSDGKIAYNGPRMSGLSDPKSSSSGGTPTSASALLDRQWHMLTVSTQPDHTKGYRLFLDGQLVGQISNTSMYNGQDGTPLLVPGGAPAALSGPIHLCTRADNNNTRYFNGKVAYLGLYDQRLDETQIMMLYQAVQAANVTKALLALGNSETLPQPAPPPSPAVPASAPVEEALALPPAQALMTTLSQDCLRPLHYNGTQINACVTIHGGLEPVCYVDNQGWQVCAAPPAAAPSPGTAGEIMPASLVAIPSITRITDQGNACLLPTVVNGDILADCVKKNGSAMCYVSNTTMERCMPGDYEAGSAMLAARHAVQNERKHHSGIVAAAVIGALAAATFVIILIVALVKMQRKTGGAGPSSFRKFNDEGGYSGAPLKPYPGPPYMTSSAEAGEVEMHAPAGSGSSPRVPAPETPSPSFTGAETLGAGLESLRAPSQQSASTSADDPEVMSVERPGRLPGMRGSETRIMPTSSASPPTERVY
ncbi:hypothetical protein CVIRNUC_008519 [Coccomyxa viridis]|uniref:Uncharacterized protein n=1 Tax=Coccomyxa viridis TaxID=1274662 RepID=A0AAV1IDS2_9CHLO|nr:hypothetical protein CVIRNUC_008519 [Coccomyxa viridis]